MAVLVIADHDNASLKDSTNKTVTAALVLSGDVDVLVAGKDAKAAADAAAKIAAGASLVQLYTGFIYRGPELIREAVKALR